MLVEQFVFQDDRKIVLINRILYPVIVFEKFETAGGHLFFQLPEDAGK
jgi:hypothetical protein